MPSTTYTDASFGARAIGTRTDNVGASATDLSAEEDRYGQVELSEGIITPADSFLPVSGGAASWDVDFGSGSAKADYAVVDGTTAGQGKYLVRLASATEAVTLDSADGSNPRIDEVYLIVADDAYDGGGVSLPRFGYRKGDAAGSPVEPGPDGAWDAYLLLATINLPTAVGDIEACTITDERVHSGLILGDGVEFSFDADDAVINIPTGGTIRLRINGTDEVTIVDGTIDAGTNDITNVGDVDGVTVSDHDTRHQPGGADAIATAAAGTIEPDDAAAEGAATSLARSDHTHAIAAAVPTAIGDDTTAEGVSTSFARADHVHGIDGGLFDDGMQMQRDVQSAGWDDVNASWTSYKEQAGFTFTKPAGWTSYDILVTATAYFADDSGGFNTEVELRCDLGTSNYEAFGICDADAASGTQLVATVLAEGETGNLTIAADTKADAPYVVRDTQISCVAHRVS